MKEDDDKLVGYWIDNRPYVWINNDNFKNCRRLYLLYDEDEVYLYTRKGKGMPERKTSLKNFNWLFGYGKVSLLDIWKSVGKREKCIWVKKYFDVYIPKRDGELQYLDVRVNGKKFKAEGDKDMYLRKAKIMPKIPYFMKSNKKIGTSL